MSSNAETKLGKSIMSDFTLASPVNWVKVKSSFILISFLTNLTQKNRPRAEY